MATEVNPRCARCDAPTGATEPGEVDFAALPGLRLADVPVRTCDRCGDVSFDVPQMDALFAALALALVGKPSRLTGEELRLLRNHLEWGSEEAARRLGVAVETYSRWEHQHQPVNAIADRFVRALVLAHEGMPGAVDLLDLELPAPAVPLAATARWSGETWSIDPTDRAVRAALREAERRYRTPSSRVA